MLATEVIEVLCSLATGINSLHAVRLAKIKKLVRLWMCIWL